MINIDAKNRELIPCSIDEWLEINHKRYFVKRQRTRLDYCEIVAEKIAARFGIICAHYEGLRMGHKIYLLSEDLASIGAFKPISEYGPHNPSLYTFWELFERIYPSYSNQLLQELIRVYLMDIIIMNSDRNHTNWGIIITSSGPHICIFDNELILRGDDVKLTADFIDGDNLTALDDKPCLTEELDYFLETSTEEYLLLFEEMLNTLTPEVFEQILNEVEEEYQDTIEEKIWALHLFSDNYFELKRLLQSHLKKYQR